MVHILKLPLLHNHFHCIHYPELCFIIAINYFKVYIMSNKLLILYVSQRIKIYLRLYNANYTNQRICLCNGPFIHYLVRNLVHRHEFPFVLIIDHEENCGWVGWIMMEMKERFNNLNIQYLFCRGRLLICGGMFERYCIHFSFCLAKRHSYCSPNNITLI